MQIGSMLASIRKEHGMTQDEFARQFHVTRQTVSNWENEKSYPDLATLVKISDEFDVSLDAMLKGDADMVEKLDQRMILGKHTILLSIVGMTACFIMWLNSLVHYCGIWEPVVWLVCLLVCANELLNGLRTKKKDKGKMSNHQS